MLYKMICNRLWDNVCSPWVYHIMKISNDRLKKSYVINQRVQSTCALNLWTCAIKSIMQSEPEVIKRSFLSKFLPLALLELSDSRLKCSEIVIKKIPDTARSSAIFGCTKSAECYVSPSISTHVQRIVQFFFCGNKIVQSKAGLSGWLIFFFVVALIVFSSTSLKQQIYK